MKPSRSRWRSRTAGPRSGACSGRPGRAAPCRSAPGATAGARPRGARRRTTSRAPAPSPVCMTAAISSMRPEGRRARAVDAQRLDLRDQPFGQAVVVHRRLVERRQSRSFQVHSSPTAAGRRGGGLGRRLVERLRANAAAGGARGPRPRPGVSFRRGRRPKAVEARWGSGQGGGRQGLGRGRRGDVRPARAVTASMFRGGADAAVAAAPGRPAARPAGRGRPGAGRSAAPAGAALRRRALGRARERGRAAATTGGASGRIGGGGDAAHQPDGLGQDVVVAAHALLEGGVDGLSLLGRLARGGGQVGGPALDGGADQVDLFLADSGSPRGGGRCSRSGPTGRPARRGRSSCPPRCVRPTACRPRRPAGPTVRSGRGPAPCGTSKACWARPRR